MQLRKIYDLIPWYQYIHMLSAIVYKYAPTMDIISIKNLTNSLLLSFNFTKKNL
jgi:hypothetical protein